MRVLVAVKRVVDYAAHIRIKADQTGVETDHVKMTMNPFDEIALEEAIRFKERQIVSEIVVVTIGVIEAQETLRTALAMGADRAILVQADDDLQPLAVAKTLKAIVDKEKPELILLGKQAIDDDSNQTGQMLAGLLSWPQATFASKVEFSGNTVTVTREVDGGLECLALQLPAVITSDLRLNEPRFISLPQIVQAKRKPLEIIALQDLGVDTKPRLQIKQVAAPQPRAMGVKVASVAELIAKLKQEAQVLS